MPAPGWTLDPAGLAPARAEREDLGNGAFVLRSPEPLQTPARCIGDWLERWSDETPDTIFLAERSASEQGGRLPGWRTLSYGETRVLVGRIGQWLLDASLDSKRPVVILSDNSIDHALLVLAAMHVGQPVCTVSSAYSRLPANHAKLAGIIRQLRPSLVYANDAAGYGAALAAVSGRAADGHRMPLVLSHGASEIAGAIDFHHLQSRIETHAVLDALRRIVPDTHAKYLLTSGSTGHPKVVINTHRMLCANQQMILQCWRFLAHEKPIVLDWLPWSHTFGANHNFNMVLAGGGTLYIDDGRPMPGLVDKTIRNLREVRPTLYFNVPSGLDALATAMEADETLAQAFFGRLRALFYAGAALPQSTWTRLEKVARRVSSEPVWFTCAWGSTETSPLVTSVHWPIESAGTIGLPAPGMALKFVPNGGKLEMRVKGPSVFPGYLDAPDLTAAAFDDEGYYLIGDAGRLVDEAHPELGVAFDGRVAEDFKLTTGTWVSVGTLRLRAISALSPLAQDIVITGQDRDEIGLLIFPSAACRALDEAERTRRIAAALREMGQGMGSSQRPTRALVMDEPPDVAAGEITDKGYLNQRAILARRMALVEMLHAGSDKVIVAD